MPQIFKIGSYWIYFWSNESDPLEPIHVHVAEGSPISGLLSLTYFDPEQTGYLE